MKDLKKGDKFIRPSDGKVFEVISVNTLGIFSAPEGKGREEFLPFSSQAWEFYGYRKL